MSDTVIKVENLWKEYSYGTISHATMKKDLQSWWARCRGKPDPNTRIDFNQEPGTRNQKPDSFWALKDISFDVKQGEILGIIGKNGAGKSTLLKIMSRVTTPTKGQMKIKGHIASLLEVGTGFHPELTGRENIFLNGAIMGMNKSEIRRKFDEIVAFAEVEKFIDTPVKRYSSGMYVRLAFAVAAHLEPEILIVDEVLAVGDVEFQKKCLGKMEDVVGEGRTVLFVSHNMATIRKLCKKAVLLQEGEMHLIGDAEDIISKYLLFSSLKRQNEITLPPNNPGSPGMGIQIRLVSDEGILQSVFKIGQVWQIIFEFEMFKSTSHVISGIGLGTIDGISIITYWSKPEDLAPGRYRAVFVCDVPLKACELQITVGLSENNRNFYYFEEVGRVSISEVAVGEQPVRSSGVGLLVNHKVVEIEPMYEASVL